MIGWWQTSFVPPDPLSDSLIIIDKRLPEGEHSIPLPDVVPQTASFVTVQVDDAIWAFSVATHSRPRDATRPGLATADPRRFH